MGKPLSLDFRERAVADVEGWLSQRFKVSRRAWSAGASARPPAVWLRPCRAVIASRIALRLADFILAEIAAAPNVTLEAQAS